MFGKLLGAGLVSGLLLGYAGDMYAASPTVYDWSGIRVIPAEYTQNNRPMVYSRTTHEQGEAEVYEFFVFDENFSEVKTFRTLPLVSGTVVRKVQEREYTYRDVYCHYTQQIGQVIDIDGVTTGITEEKAVEWVKERFGRAEVSKLLDGRTCIAYEFWNEYQVGPKYPNRYFVLEGETWVDFVSEYSGEWGPFGEWGEPREETYTQSINPCEFEIITPDGGDPRSIYLIQNLFGDSGSFKYLLPATTETTLSGEDEYSRWTETRPVVTGIRAMDDNNQEVTTIDLPSGYYFESYADVALLTMNGKTYAILEAQKEGGDNEYCSIVYVIDAQSSIPTQIAITPSTKVSPRTPMRGERVTVTLGEQASKEGCDVKVVSTAGQTVMTTRVAAGESAISLDTDRLQKGMYIVTVNTAHSATEAAKIVVR